MDDNNNVSEWVDARLAQLAADADWKPDASRALSRLQQKRRTRNTRRLQAAVLIAAACAVVVALPSSRRLIRRFWTGSHIINIGQVSADVKALKDGQIAPDFVLKDARGADLRLSSYRGKVVLLNFWATWCHGCTTEVPWLTQFQRQYQNQGFTVIGVSMDDNWEPVKTFLAKESVNYPVVVGNQRMAQPYGLDAMPMTFLIGRDGKIAATSVGMIDRTACEHQIAELTRAR